MKLEDIVSGVYGENEIENRAKIQRDSWVVFRGKGNRLFIDDDVAVIGLRLTFEGDDGIVRISRRSVSRANIAVGNKSSIVIGEGFSATATAYLSAAEGTEITIGDNCLFAAGVRIVSHDHHPIFDIGSGARINQSKSVVVGNNVWIAQGVTVAKGSEIGSGSIIGAMSLVTGSFPENSLLVGIPAKLMRSGVRWERKNLMGM